MVEKMTKKEIKERERYIKFRNRFNEIVMEELGLSIDDDTARIIEVSELDEYGDEEVRFIIYREDGKKLRWIDDVEDVLESDELEFDCLRNPRVMLALFTQFCANNIVGEPISHAFIKKNDGSKRGMFVYTIRDIKGNNVEYKSNLHVNESTQVLDLICQINSSLHYYKDELDERFGPFESISMIRKKGL